MPTERSTNIACIFFLVGLVAVFGWFLFLAGVTGESAGGIGLGCLIMLLAIGAMILIAQAFSIDGMGGIMAVLVILAVIVLGLFSGLS